MATKLQIARAQARVALAQASGKTLPPQVVETARLELSDAEDYGQSRLGRESAQSEATRRADALRNLMNARSQRPQHHLPGRFSGRGEPADLGEATLAALELLRNEDAVDHGPVYGDVELRRALRTMEEAAARVNSGLPSKAGEAPVATPGSSVPGMTAVSGADSVKDARVEAVESAGEAFRVHKARVERNNLFSRNTAPNDLRVLFDTTVIQGMRAVNGFPNGAGQQLPMDNRTRDRIIASIAADVIAMDPERARELVDAIEDGLSAVETAEAAEDARLS